MAMYTIPRMLRLNAHLVRALLAVHGCLQGLVVVATLGEAFVALAIFLPSDHVPHDLRRCQRT